MKLQNKSTGSPWKTKRGYDFFEAISALQKSIRRGLLEDALYWGEEIGCTSPNHAARLWSRLHIIVSEDVGMADSEAMRVVTDRHNRWKERKSHEDAPLYFLHAVAALVQAPKSRLVDSAIHALAAEPSRPVPADALDPAELERIKQQELKQIPDYALDKHTIHGRQMGRGVEHFYTEGTKLANCTVPDPFLERAKTADLARKASKETDGKVAAQESEGSRDISPQY